MWADKERHILFIFKFKLTNSVSVSSKLGFKDAVMKKSIEYNLFFHKVLCK